MKLDNFSILIGGEAGYGIDRSSLIIARLLNRMGYRVYIYRDYPSLIRGGHTFSIIRAAARTRVNVHEDKVEMVLALNQDTFDFHKIKLKDNGIIIFDPAKVKADNLPTSIIALAIPLTDLVKEEKGAEIMRNSALLGSFCRVSGIEWGRLEEIFKENFPKELEANLRVARRGFDVSQERLKIVAVDNKRLPLLTGNEALSLGLIRGGLKAYLAYPMTPSSTILHFLAGVADKFGLKVIQPESEIGVVLTALGFAYAGEKVAVGTSGGGFCLMTEGVSFSGMAELPLVFIVGQRTGPSTGLPTYTGQTELHFVLHAGQGEFTRLVVAPGDAEEAYYWGALSLKLAWKYQIPSFILTDKTLAEGTFNFDLKAIASIPEISSSLWERKGEYKRYLDTETGISPLAFAPDSEATVKINSYEHTEAGITTEDPMITKKMQEKRLRKQNYLAEELDHYQLVKTYGEEKSSTALLCWGSNKGVCVELAERLGLKVVQPLVLNPFPLRQFQKALEGAKKIIAIENNATAQLVKLINRYGFKADEKILKYDGRPFALDELEFELSKVLE